MFGDPPQGAWWRDLGAVCVMGGRRLRAYLHRAGSLAAAGTLLVAGCTLASADTIEWALVQAYQNNPSLNAQRAALRATDENVPQALSGFRPKISATVSAGPSYTNQTTKLVSQSTFPNTVTYQTLAEDTVPRRSMPPRLRSMACAKKRASASVPPSTCLMRSRNWSMHVSRLFRRSTTESSHPTDSLPPLAGCQCSIWAST